MYKNYIVLDVETPNKCNNAISSIAMLVVKENEKPRMIYSLINPESEFDDFNIKLTGITPEKVANAPVFPQFWDQHKDLISDNIVVGHNIYSFDLSVLGKTLRRYGIEMPCIKYLDTFLLAKSLMNPASSKLTDISREIGYDYSAHIASDDVKATNNLFVYLQDNYEVDLWDLRTYDFSNKCSNINRTITNRTSNLSDATKQLLELKDLINDISEDDRITDEEIDKLNVWLKNNEDLHGNYPYDKIYDTVTSILEDGIMDPIEEVKLLNTIKEFLNLKTEKNISIDLSGKYFCLTGDFINGTKSEISEKLTALGAMEQKNVNKKTNFLFVGGLGSDRWKFSSAGGGKISKAHELNDKGSDIHIIHELDLFEQLLS